jgi:transposase InsO family protein
MKQVVRNVINKCARCKLLYAQPAAPLMAPLPAHRIRPHGRPFSMVGIDYFGPFTISMLRRKLKRYGVMFTCLNTRAVHLEVADSLDTDSFLLAFWRFADRRGRPHIVYSDNGTNLVAGDREIREQLDQLDQEKIGSNLANRYIEWHFSPPAAPHFGGAWERLIKSAKSAFRIATNEQSVNDEVFRSYMTRVEALLNDRALTDVPVDAKEPVALSPSHFLIGELIDNALPEDPPPVCAKLSSKSWRTAQAMATHFWRRWMHEYIPNLIERRKWMNARRSLAVNDLVLVVDPATPRGEWPIGRVHEIRPDPDGVVRSATVAVW